MKTLLLVVAILAGHGYAQDQNLESGLTLRVYDIARPLDHLAPLRADQTPNVDRRIDRLDLRDDESFGGPLDYFVVEAFGYLHITEPGRYEFALTSDDGSRLMIDETPIILHDGLHGDTTMHGGLDLMRGLHAFRVDMFENTGGAALVLAWKTPGATEFEVVPSSAYRTVKGVTRVTSPGRKVILDGREHFRPGDGLALDGVHPGWTLEAIRPADFEPQVGGMDFLPDGRLVLSTFRPVNNGEFREVSNGTLWILNNVLRGDASSITVEQIASGFHDPAGVVVVDGDVYVSHRPGIERLRDLDRDGNFEIRETFAEPWIGDNYHHFSFGLKEHGGWIYGALSTSIYFGNTMEHDNVRGEVIAMNGPNPPHRGTCYRIHIETRDIEWLAGGFRTPNGVEVTADGDVFVTDNQGAWLPASKLVHVKPGRFYGHYNGTAAVSDRHPNGGAPALNAEKPVSPPAVWLPQNEACNSPATPLRINHGEFAGQFFLAEITMGGIRRVFLEEVGGELQGAVFRFTQGLECGLNRLIEGPDGCLYAGGIGAGGNWTWRGTQFGLQRLRPNGKTAFEYHSIMATPDGFEVRLTQRVDRAWLEDPANYTVRQWQYHATPEYGGPKINEHRLAVARAVASPSGNAVRLVIPGLRAGSVVSLRANPESESGESMWSTEAWYTLNHIPAALPDVRPLARGDLAFFQEPHGEWVMVGNTAMDDDDSRRLVFEPGGGVMLNGTDGVTNDLVSAFDHGDVELHVEFMVPDGSNSGIYLQGRYEIQVFDSFGKSDPQHSDCGGIYQRWDPARGEGNEGYEGVAPRVNAALPPGRWQTYDITFRAPKFDDQGNKTANARFERVVHNGVLIHHEVELNASTRGAYPGEVAFGPLRFQGDHGPVAYRNLKVRHLP